LVWLQLHLIENMVVYYPNIVNEGVNEGVLDKKKLTIYKYTKVHYELYTLISHILFVSLLKYLMIDVSFNNTYSHSSQYHACSLIFNIIYKSIKN